MSPRTKEQFEEIRQKSTVSIKKAALELFAHKGYHSTSISQIAKAAGVSKGLLYNYFENKEALLENIIMEAVSTGEEMMNVLLAAPISPEEQLKQLTEASFAMIEQDPHYWKLMTSLAFQTDALSSLMPVLKKKQKMAIEAMIQLFEKIGTEQPEEAAYYYSAVMDGIVLHYMQFDEYPAEQMKTYVLNQFIK
jgi:AcrR family transcriptional regulator